MRILFSEVDSGGKCEHLLCARCTMGRWGMGGTETDSRDQRHTFPSNNIYKYDSATYVYGNVRDHGCDLMRIPLSQLLQITDLHPSWKN